MSNWSQSPAYKINGFVASNLYAQEIIPPKSEYITQAKYEDIELQFIVPAQQTPELVTSYDKSGEDLDGFTDLPFITYTVTTEGYSDQTYMTCGQLSYILYTADIDKMIEIVQYIIDLCKREEYSAADLNDYLESDTNNPFDFKSLSIQSAIGPMETESVNGRHSYLIVINFDCVYDYISTQDNSLGPFSNKQNMWH